MRLTLALDASQIAAYLTCPEMWNLHYNQCLESATLKKDALDKGTAIHALCDIYYKLRGMSPEVDYSKHSKAAIDIIRDNKTLASLGFDAETSEFIFTRFMQYVLYWNTIKGDFVPITKHGMAAVEIGFSEIILDTSEYLFILEGRIDLITSMSGKVFWVDHKTQDRTSNLYIHKAQFLTYELATGLPGMINYIGLQKEVKPDSFRRSQLISSPAWRLEQWRQQIINKCFIPIVKNLSLEKSFELDLNACSGAFDSNPCQYTKICETQDNGIKNNIKKFAFVKVEPWRPWK